MADTVVPPPPAPAPPAYKDRSTGLLVFGIIKICLGALALLAALFTLLSAVLVSRAAPPRLSLMAPAILLYIFLAAVFVTLGAGSIGARRWARALTLIISWIWLLSGTLGLTIVLAVVPATMHATMANMPQGPRPVPAGLMAAIVTLMMAFAALFYVVLPLVLILFYRSRDVRETCNHRDPVERWTDRTPLPIIGASLLLAYGGCACASIALARPVFPVFRWVLAGTPARLACLALTLVWLVLAVAIFRRRMWGWWAALVALVVAAISSVTAFSGGGLVRYYEKIGMSEQQLAMLHSIPIFRSSIFAWGMLFVSVLFLAYMVWLRRYFVPSPPAT